MGKYIDIRPKVYFMGVGYTIGMFLHRMQHMSDNTDVELSTKDFFYHLSGKYFSWVYD